MTNGYILKTERDYTNLAKANLKRADNAMAAIVNMIKQAQANTGNKFARGVRGIAGCLNPLDATSMGIPCTPNVWLAQLKS